jgi:hypothetical protein
MCDAFISNGVYLDVYKILKTVVSVTGEIARE